MGTTISTGLTQTVETRRNVLPAPDTFSPRGSVTITPGVAYAGKTWTQVAVASQLHGTRQLVPLASLTSGAVYTYAVEIANPGTTDIHVNLNWVNAPGSFTAIIAPGEVIVRSHTASRAYDSTYRFGDIGAYAGETVLVRSGTVQAGDDDRPFTGSDPDNGGYAYDWSGAVNDSESIETLTTARDILPVLVDGYEARREARSIVHNIINRTEPDITLRAAGLRKGTFTLLFDDEAAALDAFELLGMPRSFAISDPERAAIGMTFVVADGDVSIRLAPETRDHFWVVTPFHEVTV